MQIGNDTNWKSVTCAGFYTMAVRTDSTLWAWGYNAGRLGDGTRESRHRPVQIGSDTNWSFIANSIGHTMGVRSDGTLWAWGDNYNYDGLLGHGGAANKSSPVQVRSKRAWKTVACGDQSIVALAADGTVWSWGSNSSGQLGDGARSIPVQIGSETGWTSTTLTAGASHAMLLRSDGSLWSWGCNYAGQLGDGTMIDKSLPVQIGSESNWAYVACGGSHTAALRDDGSLWAWGNNSEGQLGNGAIIREGFVGPMLTNYPVSTPLRIASERAWASVACGSAHTVAVSTDGSLWAWGSNDWNRLGDGTTEDRSSPVQIGNATNWSKVACGESHTVAVRTDGSLWAWGHNGEGQLGDGTLIERNTPIQIGSSTSWASVNCGSDHTVAMSLDGSLWGWGSNYKGQLGVDTSGDPSSTPHLIGSSETWTWKPQNTSGFHHPIKTIACGAYHTLAMGSDGTLWAWGASFSGQLGNDSTTSWRNAPAQFGNVRTWTSVAGGRNFTVAIRSDGTFWGSTNHGQLGPGHLLAPTLAWPPRGEHTFSFSGPDEVAQDASITLSATLSSGLPVTYTVVGPATLEGTTLIPTAPGRLLVTAYPKRDDAWTRIEPISRTIEVTHTSFTAREAFNTFITANSSLTGPDAEPTAIPFADGLPNLLRYAFHTDFSAVGVKGYEPSRASGGFPIVTTTQDTVRIKFVRRKGSGLVYTPMKSTSLNGGEWLPLSTSPIIGDLDEFFELVVHEEPRLDQCFVRVEVSLP